MMVIIISILIAASVPIHIHEDIMCIMIFSNLAQYKFLLLPHHREILLSYLLDHEFIFKLLMHLLSKCMIQEPLLMGSIYVVLLQEGVDKITLTMGRLIQWLINIFDFKLLLKVKGIITCIKALRLFNFNILMILFFQILLKQLSLLIQRMQLALLKLDLAFFLNFFIIFLNIYQGLFYVFQGLLALEYF